MKLKRGKEAAKKANKGKGKGKEQADGVTQQATGYGEQWDKWGRGERRQTQAQQRPTNQALGDNEGGSVGGGARADRHEAR